ncbi:unnamed protein product [Boreogadus saida]
MLHEFYPAVGLGRAVGHPGDLQSPTIEGPSLTWGSSAPPGGRSAASHMRQNVVNHRHSGHSSLRLRRVVQGKEKEGRSHVCAADGRTWFLRLLGRPASPDAQRLWSGRFFTERGSPLIPPQVINPHERHDPLTLDPVARSSQHSAPFQPVPGPIHSVRFDAAGPDGVLVGSFPRLTLSQTVTDTPSKPYTLWCHNSHPQGAGQYLLDTQAAFIPSRCVAPALLVTRGSHFPRVHAPSD